MRLTKDTFMLGLIIILIAVIMLQRCSKDKQPEPINRYIYKTDSLYKDKYFKAVEELKNKIPPKVITRWKDPIPGEDIIIEKVPDSTILYIGKLKTRLSIADNFIKNYPTNPKLLELKLDKSNLELTTLDINNKAETFQYPLYLDNYSYQWLEKQMTTSDYHIKKERTKFDMSNLYIVTGYDYLNKNNTIGLDYTLKLGRIKVMADTKLLLQKSTDNIEANIGIGYKLFK